MSFHGTCTLPEPVAALEPEPSPGPVPETVAAPEPVLQAAIDSGHAVIVPVGFEPSPVPSPEPSPATMDTVREKALAAGATVTVETVKRMAPAERKAWNRAVADLARERDQYRAVMDAWDRVTELRLAGVSPADAVDAILGTVSNVSPIRSA